jgi:hypothetical protein
MDSILLEDNPHWIKNTNEVIDGKTIKEYIG